ncbi:MAG: lactonase family protein [Bacteroidales bacterium]
MKNSIKIIFISIALILSSCQKSDNIFLVSGYSAENKNDVMLCSLNDEGYAKMLSGFTVGDNPSFFAFGKNNLIYFANEVDSFNLSPGGGITTFRLDKESKQFVRESSVNQGAAGPCHITLSNDGKYLITANYGSGSVSVVRLNPDGIPERVTDVIFYGERSHPHMTLYNHRKQIYYVSDLGLDRIHQLRLDTTIGRLMTEDVPYLKCEPGSGPRHMAIDKNSLNLFVINELNSTVSVFNILADTTDIKQTVSTLPEGYQDTSFCADLHLSANGRRLYGSNRGHNSLVTFAVGSDGRLSSPGHQSCGGNWPRNFAVSPSGKFFVVANQRSDEVSIIPAGKNKSEEAVSSLKINAPACVKFLNK